MCLSLCLSVAAGTTSKYIIQKWFHQRKFVPYVQEEVLCDKALMCREYISTPDARQTAILTKQGFDLFKEGKKEEARALLQQAVALSPHDIHANLYLVRVCAMFIRSCSRATSSPFCFFLWPIVPCPDLGFLL